MHIWNRKNLTVSSTTTYHNTVQWDYAWYIFKENNICRGIISIPNLDKSFTSVMSSLFSYETTVNPTTTIWYVHLKLEWCSINHQKYSGMVVHKDMVGLNNITSNHWMHWKTVKKRSKYELSGKKWFYQMKHQYIHLLHKILDAMSASYYKWEQSQIGSKLSIHFCINGLQDQD